MTEMTMGSILSKVHAGARRIRARLSCASLQRLALQSCTALTATLFIAAAGCSHVPSTVTETRPPSIAAVQAGDGAILIEPSTHSVLLSWVAGDSAGYRIWFARSADHGDSWTAPVPVTPVGETVQMHGESSPRMVCDETGNLGIAWTIAAGMAGQRPPDSDLRFARSSDGGRTWSPPVTINDDAAGGPGSHMLHGLALRPNGSVYAAWLDSRPGGDSLALDESAGPSASVYLARSDDHGAHWSKNVAEWSGVCPGCRVGLVIDPFGIPYVTFRKHYPGQIRDVVVARTDFAPFRLRRDDWEVRDCPHSGPPIALSRDGSLRIAWFTGARTHTGVYFLQTLPESMDSTATPVTILANNHLPVVHLDLGEVGMSGTLIALDADSTGGDQLTLARVESSGRRLVERFVVPGTRGASYPKVATAVTGKFAYVVWSSRDGEGSKLRVARWNVGR